MDYDQYVRNVLYKAIRQPSGKYAVHPDDTRQSKLLNKMIDNGLVKSNSPIVYFITSKGLEARLNRGVSTNQTTKV